MIVTDLKALRKPAREAKAKDGVLKLAGVLFEALAQYRAQRAQGVAAQQVGGVLRVFVMKLPNMAPVCLVNPVISKEKGRQLGPETCLSLPGVTCQVKRPMKVVLKGFNQYFRPVKYRLFGFHARIACHEIDHLDGKLIIDIGGKEKQESEG